MSDLKRVVKMAKQLADATKVVEELSAKLKEASKLQMKLEREDLPTLMKEVGLTELKLEDGQKIKVVPDCLTSITEVNRIPAIKWLVANGFGGLVKTVVQIEFGRGEITKAEKAAKKLAATYPQTMSSETVHHSTLKAFVKEQLREGKNIPMDLFGVQEFDKAVISK